MVHPGNEISESEKTDILIGNDNIIKKKTLETYSWIEESLDASVDKDGPALNVLYEPIWTGYISLKKRGIKLKGVTEVTVNNIQYCKKLMEVSKGSVKLRSYFFIVIIGKQIYPLLNMFQFTFFLFAWKVIVKALGSIFNVLHSPFNNTFLIRGMQMML